MNGTTMTQNKILIQDPGSIWKIKAAADFNGDGKADILWQNDSGEAAIWLVNDNLITGDSIKPNPGPDWRVKGAADTNGDGKADILWQHRQTGEAAVWLMSGLSRLGGDTLTPNLGTSWHLVANAG
jgi:hypothetical protein